MSRLTDLIARVKAKDAALGADLEAEFRALAERRVFGLNFERHRPEAVELPRRPVRKGDKVRVLPPRGSAQRGDQRLWRVLRTEADGSGRVAHLALLDGEATQTVALDDLVVVAEFRDPIYPGLRSTGRVERGGDKPYHTVINAENYHALQTLLYTHRGRVDCIYIDPPYNTGAKDWKYNNDYVDGEDLYRHSKWLAFMERRLLIAKELLNPDNSVLIVTIDEKEYLRLGMLLEQTFPSARTQMVSTVINPGGSQRTDGFARVEEYIYFVMIGRASPSLSTDDMLGEIKSSKGLQEIWGNMMRRGTGSSREDRPNLFYPVYVDPQSGAVVGAGPSLPLGVAKESFKVPDGVIPSWPVRSNGEDGRWQIGADACRKMAAQGFVKSGRMRGPDNGGYVINYLSAGVIKAIQEGQAQIVGRDPTTGAVEVEMMSHAERETARTIWNRGAHNASTNGTGMLRVLLPTRKFPFPKSLYAVEDTLRFFVKRKPEAVILDFFAGSGTTAHAVMRLNRQDGGRRTCISITNNEVAADEQADLRKKGLRPGDPEWEQWGICDHITKPRIAAAITGKTPAGDTITGDYKFTDEFPLAEGFEENVEFFTLTYESPWRVSLNRDFAAIAPLLWLRAGAQGRRIDAVPAQGWAVVERYGLLVDLDRARPFLDALAAADGPRFAFIVTDDDRRFQMVCAALPEGVEPVRLYESYLANFEINTGRD